MKKTFLALCGLSVLLLGCNMDYKPSAPKSDEDTRSTEQPQDKTETDSETR